MRNTIEFNDFSTNAAPRIRDAVAIMQTNDNIVIAGGTYAEDNYMLIPVGGVIAGLGGRWLADDPSTNMDAGGLADAFDYSGLPVINAVALQPASIFRADGVMVGGRLAIGGLQFLNGKAGTMGPVNAGGAIRLENLGSALPVRIGYCRFTANTASNFGGAVYLSSVANAQVEVSEFEDNKADYDDGGTVCYDKGMGGAIASLQSTLTVTNCLFQQNVAHGGKGVSPRFLVSPLDRGKRGKRGQSERGKRGQSEILGIPS